MKKWILAAGLAAIVFAVGCASTSSQGATETSGSAELAAAGTVTSPSVAAGGKEDGQNPVMSFIGPYASDRATILVSASGADEAEFIVTWSSSAAETTEWTMSGTFNSETLTVEYTNGTKTNYMYKEDGTLESEETEYTDGSGSITFQEGDPLALVWENDKEPDISSMTFTWNA